MSERTPARKGGYQQPPHEQYFQQELPRQAKEISQATMPSSPLTAAQARKMPLHQLLEVPVRSTIYYRGCTDTQQATKNLQSHPKWRQQIQAERTNTMKSTKPNNINKPSLKVSFSPSVGCYASTSRNMEYCEPTTTSRMANTTHVFEGGIKKVAEQKQILKIQRESKGRNTRRKQSMPNGQTPGDNL